MPLVRKDLEVPRWQLQPPRLQDKSVFKLKPGTQMYEDLLCSPQKLQCISSIDENANKTSINTSDEQLHDKYIHIQEPGKTCRLFRLPTSNRSLTEKGHQKQHEKLGLIEETDKYICIRKPGKMCRLFRLPTSNQIVMQKKHQKQHENSSWRFNSNDKLSTTDQMQYIVDQNGNIMENLANSKKIQTQKWIFGNLGCERASSEYIDKCPSVSTSGERYTCPSDINGNMTVQSNTGIGIHGGDLAGVGKNHPSKWEIKVNQQRCGTVNVPPIFQGECSAKVDKCQMYDSVVGGTRSNVKMEESSFSQFSLSNQLKTSNFYKDDSPGNTRYSIEQNTKNMSQQNHHYNPKSFLCESCGVLIIYDPFAEIGEEQTLPDGIPTSYNVPAPEEIPTSYNVSAPEGIPTSYNVPAPEGIPTSYNVPASEGIPTSYNVPAPEGIPTSYNVPASEGIPTSYNVPASEGIPTSYNVPASEGIPTSCNVPASEGIPTSCNVPASEGIPTSYNVSAPEGIPTSSNVPASEGISLANMLLPANGKTIHYKLFKPDEKGSSFVLKLYNGKSIDYSLLIPDKSSTAFELVSPAFMPNPNCQLTKSDEKCITLILNISGRELPASSRILTPDDDRTNLVVKLSDGKSIKYRQLRPDEKGSSFVLLSPGGRCTSCKSPTIKERPVSSKPQWIVNQQETFATTENQNKENPASPQQQSCEEIHANLTKKRIKIQHTYAKVERIDDKKCISHVAQRPEESIFSPPKPLMLNTEREKSEYNLKTEFLKMHELYRKALAEENLERTKFFQTSDGNGSTVEGGEAEANQEQPGFINCGPTAASKQNISINKDMEQPLTQWRLASFTEQKDYAGDSSCNEVGLYSSKNSVDEEQNKYAPLSPDSEDNNTEGRLHMNLRKSGRNEVRKHHQIGTKKHHQIGTKKDVHFIPPVLDIRLFHKQRNRRKVGHLKSSTSNLKQRKHVREHLVNLRKRGTNKIAKGDGSFLSQVNQLQGKGVQSPSFSSTQMNDCQNVKSVLGFSSRTPNMLGLSKFTRLSDDTLCEVSHSILDKNISNKVLEIVPKSNSFQTEQECSQKRLEVGITHSGTSMELKARQSSPKPKRRALRSCTISKSRGSFHKSRTIRASRRSDLVSSTIKTPRKSDPVSGTIKRPRKCDRVSSTISSSRGSDSESSTIGASNSESQAMRASRGSDPQSRISVKPRETVPAENTVTIPTFYPSPVVLDSRGHDHGPSNFGSSVDSVGSNLENVGSSLENVGASLGNVRPSLENVESSLKNVGPGLKSVESSLENVGSGLDYVGSSLDRGLKGSDFRPYTTQELGDSDSRSILLEEKRKSTPGPSISKELHVSSTKRSISGEPRFVDRGQTVNREVISNSGPSMVKETEGSDFGPDIVQDSKGSDTRTRLNLETRLADLGTNIAVESKESNGRQHKNRVTGGSDPDPGLNTCKHKEEMMNSSQQTKRLLDHDLEEITNLPTQSSIIDSALKDQGQNIILQPCYTQEDSLSRHTGSSCTSPDLSEVADPGHENCIRDTTVINRNSAEMDHLMRNQQKSHCKCSVNVKHPVSNERRKYGFDFFHSVTQHDKNILKTQIQKLFVYKLTSYLDDAFLQKNRHDLFDLKSLHRCRGLGHYKRPPRCSFIGPRIVHPKQRIINILKKKLRPALISKLKERLETHRREKLAGVYRKPVKQRQPQPAVHDTVLSVKRKRKLAKETLKSAFGLVNLIQSRIKAQKTLKKSRNKCPLFLPQKTASQGLKTPNRDLKKKVTECSSAEMSKNVCDDKLDGEDQQCVENKGATQDLSLDERLQVKGQRDRTERSEVKEPELVIGESEDREKKVIDSDLETVHGLERTQKDQLLMTKEDGGDVECSSEMKTGDKHDTVCSSWSSNTFPGRLLPVASTIQDSTTNDKECQMITLVEQMIEYLRDKSDKLSTKEYYHCLSDRSVDVSQHAESTDGHHNEGNISILNPVIQHTQTSYNLCPCVTSGVLENVSPSSIPQSKTDPQKINCPDDTGIHFVSKQGIQESEEFSYWDMSFDSLSSEFKNAFDQMQDFQRASAHVEKSVVGTSNDRLETSVNCCHHKPNGDGNVFHSENPACLNNAKHQVCKSTTTYWGLGPDPGQNNMAYTPNTDPNVVTYSNIGRKQEIGSVADTWNPVNSFTQQILEFVDAMCKNRSKTRLGDQDKLVSSCGSVVNSLGAKHDTTPSSLEEADVIIISDDDMEDSDYVPEDPEYMEDL